MGANNKEVLFSNKKHSDTISKEYHIPEDMKNRVLRMERHYHSNNDIENFIAGIRATDGRSPNVRFNFLRNTRDALERLREIEMEMIRLTEQERRRRDEILALDPTFLDDWSSDSWDSDYDSNL